MLIPKQWQIDCCLRKWILPFVHIFHTFWLPWWFRSLLLHRSSHLCYVEGFRLLALWAAAAATAATAATIAAAAAAAAIATAAAAVTAVAAIAPTVTCCYSHCYCSYLLLRLLLQHFAYYGSCCCCSHLLLPLLLLLIIKSNVFISTIT